MGNLVAPNDGEVRIKCMECYDTYYTCDWDELSIPGSKTRTRGYCKSCYKGSGKWWISWTGNVVKINCNKCKLTYGVIDWADWSRQGNSSKYPGYCVECYNKKH